MSRSRTPAQPAVLHHFADSRRGREGVSRRRAAIVVLAMLAAALLSAPATQAASPQIEGVTLVNGNLQSFMPGVGMAHNLDGTPLVLGSTRYDPDGPGPELIYNDTRAGFLWQGMPAGSQGPSGGHMHIFYVDPPSLYLTASSYLPKAVADNETTVGNAIYFWTRTVQPWEWTPSAGLTFLPLPDSSWQGNALAISSDGQTVAGRIFQQIGFRTSSSAAEWTNGTLKVIGAEGAWSQANAISSDGHVVVGASGPDASSQQAARWLDGMPTPMEPEGATSTALFTSTDGQTAVGTATLSPALTELVRWDATGAAEVLAPPAGYSVDRVTAINPDATAVVGSLVSYPGCQPGGPGPICVGNDAPFLWTSTTGFTVLPENGQADFYDMSTATGVSDDGTKVVGNLSSSVQYDGSPKPTAFLWTPTTGEIQLNTLTSAAGYNYDLFDAVAISGSGTRILATGVINPPTLHDTSSVILDISGLG